MKDQQDFKIMEPIFTLFALPLKADIDKAAENL
jgi:hypothetical protein